MKINFVIPQAQGSILSQLDSFRLAENYPYWIDGIFNWAAQSYLVLREYGPDVTISTSPQSECMNFAHCMTWRALAQRQGEYRISVRADFPRLYDVDFEILQSPAVTLGAKQAYLPYWPIPGMRPRDKQRKEVSVVAYAGRFGENNLADPLVKKVKKGAINDVKFVSVEPNRWHHMEGIDVLIAVRSFDRQSYNNKPPSKLFNAWNAGIPLIAGYDSSYSTIATPGKEYFRVETEYELLEAIQILRAEKSIYQRLVDAGNKRRSEISHAAIGEFWWDQLSNTVYPDFLRWKESGGARKGRPIVRTLDMGRSILSKTKAKVLRS